jgi:membrane protein YqaA with SNARE-associated domain
MMQASKQMFILTVASAAGTMARSARHWIYQLGGLGFIPLGVLDNSVIPLPGSMDVLTIFLSARKERLWFYYASMATVGSVIGGFVTYRLARRGGKETLARRFPARKLEKTYKIFERWGLGAIAIPALLPPPVPMLPFLFAAGTMQYPIENSCSRLVWDEWSGTHFLHSSPPVMGDRYWPSFHSTRTPPYSWLSV